MNRHLGILLALLLLTIPHLARGVQHVVDEQAVFSYNAAVQAGDQAAVKAVFALNTDGASAEAQDIVLGKLIPQHPRLFLKMLQQSQFANCQACLPGLLGNLGANYDDHPAAQGHVLNRRRVALRSVHVKALAKLRDACIAELNRQIRQMQSIAGAGRS
jgi:hypothetical protein